MSILGVDLDGVVGDFTQHFGHFVYAFGNEADKGRYFPPPSGWHFGNWNLTGDFEDYYEKFIERGCYRNMPFIEGAVASLERLRALGCHIHIITNRGTSLGAPQRNYTAQTDTLTWLVANKIPFDFITFTKDKSLIRCDYMVEDAPHHLQVFIDKQYRGGTPHIIAMAQPYNKEYRHKGLYYAHDWNDICEHIEALEGVKEEDSNGPDVISR